MTFPYTMEIPARHITLAEASRDGQFGITAIDCPRHCGETVYVLPMVSPVVEVAHGVEAPLKLHWDVTTGWLELVGWLFHGPPA